ncbi:MAG: hypothetical protein RL701_5634 [Pseudomonadota bacterium]|jgi:quinol monooxygenase YgiN
MSTFTIVALTARPENLPEFLQLLAKSKIALPTEPGCTSVRMYQDATDKHRFTVVEAWESEAHHRACIDHMMHSGAWARLRELLVADPSFSYYREF